ncbi:hypothetical protein LCGC14_1056120 [marine sediment metagenome]|uniref:Uncharacterized protein n=1 Tax=marine sediment metagenome TaxID=412755 RepID=A0A0F9MRZ2_9ZZZZ
MDDMTGQQVGLILRGVSVEEARRGLVIIRKPRRCNTVVCEICDWTRCLLHKGHYGRCKFRE